MSMQEVKTIVFDEGKLSEKPPLFYKLEISLIGNTVSDFTLYKKGEEFGKKKKIIIPDYKEIQPDDKVDQAFMGIADTFSEDNITYLELDGVVGVYLMDYQSFIGYKADTKICAQLEISSFKWERKI